MRFSMVIIRKLFSVRRKERAGEGILKKTGFGPRLYCAGCFGSRHLDPFGYLALDCSLSLLLHLQHLLMRKLNGKEAFGSANFANRPFEVGTEQKLVLVPSSRLPPVF